MKTALTAVLLIGLLATDLAHAADDWTEVFPDPHPAKRNNAEMAHIGGDQALLFGGSFYSGGYIWHEDTWVYDVSANTWTEKFPASHPSARIYHAMAYTSGDDALLFGGNSSGGNRLNDTWIYDLGTNTWTQKSPASPPAARLKHGMAYIGGDEVLLFGGNIITGFNDETWVYDLDDNTWTQRFPDPHPSGRYQPGMAYIGGLKVLLFGGWDGADDNETWVYDLMADTWTLKTPATSPSARQNHDMAYIGGDQVVLYGGLSLNDETWIYDLSDNNWILDTNATDPPGSSSHALSETSMDGSSFPVLFGLNNNEDETWIFGGGDYLSFPAAIDDLKAQLFDSAIQLSWSEVTEDMGGDPLVVDHYTIYRSADPGFTPAPGDSVGSTTGVFYVDLTAAVKDTAVNHNYVVKAFDSSGEKSAESNRVGESDRDLITSP